MTDCFSEARTRVTLATGSAITMAVKQTITWRQVDDGQDLELHAWRWASDGHCGGSWKLYLQKVTDEAASVMAYDSLILTAGSISQMLLSTASVGVPPPAHACFIC